MSTPDPKTTAQKLVNNLTALYGKFEDASNALLREANAASRLGRWFSGRNSAAEDDLHQKFYESVENRCTLLGSYLAQLSPEEAEPLASQAVSVVLNPVPDSHRDTAGWMRLAAEPLCEPLLPYLQRAELEEIRARYVKVYPKRRMFPRQKTFLKRLDEVIQEKS